MQIEFAEATHTYTVDGAVYPSVTQILSAEGLTDYTFATHQHRNRGTLVHQIAELIDVGWETTQRSAASAEDIIAASPWDPSTTSSALVPFGMAYCTFLLQERPQWLLSEYPVASKIYHYAGRLDRYGVIRGKRTIVDIKSGEPGDAASIQQALYALALEETTGEKTEDLYAVWLRPDGTHRRLPGNIKDVSIGLHAVQLYHWRKSRGLFT